MSNLMTETAPERIYLQVGDEGEVDQPFPYGEEITWCEDAICDDNIEYIRADLHAAIVENDARLSAIYSAEQESIRPFVQLRPRMFIDGDQWCALYGENLQDGVAGFGDTPAIAAEQFDNAWINGKAPAVYKGRKASKATPERLAGVFAAMGLPEVPTFPTPKVQP